MITISMEYGAAVLRVEGCEPHPLRWLSRATVWGLAGRAPRAGERLPVSLAVHDRLLEMDAAARQRRDSRPRPRPDWGQQ